jgi:hypothetical protein
MSCGTEEGELLGKRQLDADIREEYVHKDLSKSMEHFSCLCKSWSCRGILRAE